jgi:hypothetical protein
MRFRSWVGIVIGGITDVATSVMIYFVLAVIVAMQLAPTNLSPEGQGSAVMTTMSTSHSVSAASWVLSYCATLLGGYVAARISRSHEVRVGALSSWTCLAVGVYAMMSGTSRMPIWQLLLVVASTPFVAALGGYLWLRQAERRVGRGDEAPSTSATAFGAQ